MSPRHLAAALLCVVLWGVNFVVIDTGLKVLPPLLFVALRYVFTALPAVFFLPRPLVGYKTVVLIGLLACVAQFGFLFVAMHDGLPAGIASVVIQCQALFTILFASALLRERITKKQLTGVFLAAGGMVVIAMARGGDVPLGAIALAVAGGASWGAANVVTRATRPTRPFSLLVYSALVAPIPLFALSFLVEGFGTDMAALRHVNMVTVGSLAFVVIASTLVGFGIWFSLLARYDASVVAPFALLVPAVGLVAAWLFVNERPSPLEWAGAIIAVIGLAVMTVSPSTLIRGFRTTAPGRSAVGEQASGPSV